MKDNKNISLRGRTFEGRVTSDKMHKTVTVEWPRRKYVPKYERYEKRKTSVKAHNQEEINAKEGDFVRIMETRPLSKTKKFVVIAIINEEKESKSKPAPKESKEKKETEVKKEK